MKRNLWYGRLFLMVALVLFCVMPVNGEEHGTVIDSEGNWMDIEEAERVMVPASPEPTPHPRFTQWDGKTFWAIVRVHEDGAHIEHIYCSEIRARGVLKRKNESWRDPFQIYITEDGRPFKPPLLELRQVSVDDGHMPAGFGVYFDGILGSVDRIVCDDYLERESGN